MAGKKKVVITDDIIKEIKVRAFEVYQERIMEDLSGDFQTDWLQAEKEILEEYNGN